MNTKAGWLRALCVLALSAFALSCSPGQVEQRAGIAAQPLLPAGWQCTDIGGSGSTCTDSYSGTTYTISGPGTGIGGTDYLHLAYQTVTGDFTLVAEVLSCSSTPGTAVGLMARQSLSNTSPEASVFFRPNFTGGSAPNSNNLLFHAPAGRYPARDYSSFTSMSAPLYLKMVRSGSDFAVYKSSNGTIWSQLSAWSGGEFSATGPVYVGLAVASGSSATTTAQFDHVTLTKSVAHNYTSSWVGNSLSKDSTEYVSGIATAMAVTPDGTVITNGTSGGEEAGEKAKIYKNGGVIGTFEDPPHGGAAYEGSVTSDGANIYLFGRSGPQAGIFRTGMTGAASSANMINFANAVTTTTPSGECQVSGMALGNGELYVSNATTGKVLVANPLQPVYFTSPANNSYNTVVSSAIDVSGLSNPAPQDVYQTSRESDALSYVLPGFAPGATYTVRLHFAALNPLTGAGSYVGQIAVGGQIVAPSFDPYVAAGNSVNKAVILSSSGVHPDSSGNISVVLQRTTSIRIFVNGIEVLDGTGASVFQLNVGGGKSGTWKSDVHELVDRAITGLTRPGPIAVDKRGDLWIVQEGTTFPATGKFISAPRCPGWRRDCALRQERELPQQARGRFGQSDRYRLRLEQRSVARCRSRASAEHPDLHRAHDHADVHRHVRAKRLLCACRLVLRPRRRRLRSIL